MNDTPIVNPVTGTPRPHATPPGSHRLAFLPHFIRPEELPASIWSDRAKLVFDILLAAFLAVPAIPLILVSALAVRLTSKGPAFYTQVRMGRFGRPYLLVKIRTMIDNCEQITGPQWSIPGDTRVTPLGRWLRRTHLDELPQLWNVLCGHMSLVGPRPERPEIVPSLEAQIPGYGQRLTVRPGVTGLAQCQLPADTDFASVRKKLSYDLYYIRRRSLWLDLRLVLCTAFKVAGMSYRAQRRLFALPHPEQVVEVSRLPLEATLPG